MLNVLIVYAVEEERVHLNMPQCNFHYCRTGVGKVLAALAVEHAIKRYEPDVVLNIGTAGTVDYELGSVHLCCKFVDRDMEKLQDFGVPFEIDFSKEVSDCGFFNRWVFDSICNTGDTFLTKADGTGDVFDMESFAVAKVCQLHQIPFVSVKCVTDKIGQNSIKHWEDKLAEAQATLQNFVDNNCLFVPENYVGRVARDLIGKLKLSEHPEGGWFKEVYRSNIKLVQTGLPGSFGGDRSAMTSIYYMLANKQFSAFHRIKSPEVWYFHQGSPLMIHILEPFGDYKKILLSNGSAGVLQFTVEPGCWFAAELSEGCGYSLVSCAVAPGFDFDDFELARASDLMEIYTNQKNLVGRLCR